MHFDILFTIVLTSIVQSIFGTGVLLFGTPILLILGYDFYYSLSYLLPTSLLISFFQILKNFKNIDFNFYKKIVKYSIPAIIIFLYSINFSTINIKKIIGVFLILASIKSLFPKLNSLVESTIKYEKFYLIITGAIHGITNLGGVLLSVIVFSKNFTKEITRTTIAASYLTFAIFQLFTLGVFLNDNRFMNINNLVYWASGLFIFFLVEKLFFVKINNNNYSNYFAIFLFILGAFLIIII